MREPYYRALLTAPGRWPKGWSQRDLIKQTRRHIGAIAKAPETLLQGGSWREERSNRHIVHSFLSDMPGGPLHGRDKAPEGFVESLEVRLELLRRLCLSKAPQVKRREVATELIIEQLDEFLGWRRFCLVNQDYQLHEESAWWHPSGSFFQAEETRRSLHTSRQLREAGFIALDHQAYMQRAREPLLFNFIQKGSELVKIVTILALYTAPTKKLKQDPLSWIEHALDDLRRELTRELTRRDFTAVPMKPLYSLPRESNNMRQFFIARARDIVVDEKRQLVRGALERARVKVFEEESGQQALFFDTHLVNKSSGEPDSYISVTLDSPQTDVLGALTQAIEQLEVDAAVFEHLPRVCAGMFAAAHRDRVMFGSAAGTFWDTDSGKRLCKIVGFNPQNYKHRQRVQHVRKLLSKLVLHRSATGFDEQGRAVRIKRKGPLIEMRQAEVELEIESREGMSEKHTFQSWSIDDTLWQMTRSREEGGAPAFMMLDDRAFKLDDRSSVAFNIYWTLVNRAYNDRVSDSGEFTLNLWTLYDWSGLEQSSPRVDRLRETFNTALDRMVETGLLCSWQCADLDARVTPSLEALKEARLGVIFGQTQLKMLPKIERIA